MITSTSNVQVKRLLQLQKKPKERDRQDVFVVEGVKMYREVPKDRLVHTYVSERFLRAHEELSGDSPDVTVLSDHVFESVSDTKTPQGVLCLVRQYHYGLRDLLGGSGISAQDAPRGAAGVRGPLLIALENLQDPGNLGTIVRTAEGAGVTGILLSPDCVDIYNPKVIRSTMGSVYRVPFYYAQDWHAALGELKQRGVRLFAAHLEDSDFYDRFSYCGPSAFLIGNESKGLTAAAASLADRRVRIPMCGQVESLNAAVASSLLVYEANRQRRRRERELQR